MLTPRENLLRVLRHEMPDWIPLTGHVDPYNQPNRKGMDPRLAALIPNVTWGDESTVHFSRYLGLDIADWKGPPIRTRQKSAVVETTRDDLTATTTWRTPQGSLRQVSRFSPQSGAWYTVEHAVKEVRDLPILAAVFADQEIEADPDGVANLTRRRELIGDGGTILHPLSGTPLGQMIRVHAGVETTAYLYADGRQELRDLFAVMAKAHERQVRLACSMLGDAIVTVDDTSTTTLSPAMFEEFCLDYTDRMAAIAHEAGKFYFHHSCGLIRDLLGLYRRTRMDAVHAFTIRPMGNVTVGEGKRALGPGIAIIAGVGQLYGSLEDRPAVSRSIEAMFAEAAPGDNFIANVAPDPTRTMEETAFVVAECRKHQRLAK